jgi:two-component system, NarL family, sensor histidine kinase DegS
MIDVSCTYEKAFTNPFALGGRLAVDWLRNVLATNQVVVYALYGQVFFTLGVSHAVQSMKHTRLQFGKHLRWMATFGLSHGLVEWGYVFIPIQSAYMPPSGIEALRWLQLGLMIFSFVALFQFGLRSAVRQGPLRTDVGAWSATLMAVTASLAFGLAGEGTTELSRIGVEIWTRYLLAVPGAVLGAVGIYRAAQEVRGMQLPHIARWLQISAYSLVGYGLLSLITPEHHRLLATWINYDATVKWVGVSAQVWRTLVGIGILYGMVRSLSLFNIETDRRLMEAEQTKLLEAQRELACMNQIAITLGRAKDPFAAMTEVLEQFLPFLGCTSGEIAIREHESSRGWTSMAKAGQERRWPWTGEGVSPLIREVIRTNRLVIRDVVEGGYGVGIPIHGGHQLLAVAALFRDEPVQMSPQEMQVASSLGSLCGVALENSRLWTELQHREADRTEWISRIISAQEDERRHIAHELHDEAIQSLVALCRQLDLTAASSQPSVPVQEGIEGARRQVEGLIESLRDFAHDLRPPALDDLGIAACIRRLLVDLGEGSDVTWDMKVSGAPVRLARDAEIGLFRIAQEAVRNVERHARARSVQIELSFGTNTVSLQVSDDGKGMPSRVWQGGSAAGGRLGLVGMQERASLLGGRLQIDSRPGTGTVIAVTVPVSPECSRQPGQNTVAPQAIGN